MSSATANTAAGVKCALGNPVCARRDRLCLGNELAWHTEHLLPELTALGLNTTSVIRCEYNLLYRL
jgi:hypothetical protein